MVKENGPDQLLPGLTNYNDDQLFFIANAQSHCRSKMADDLMMNLFRDSHSPSKFR